MRQKYSTDLTDEQWEIIEPLFKSMRNRKWSKRELLNAVLYLVENGYKWRNLPHDFPPYSTAHSFFRRAKETVLWDKILQRLVEVTRRRAGRNPNPTLQKFLRTPAKIISLDEGSNFATKFFMLQFYNQSQKFLV